MSKFFDSSDYVKEMAQAFFEKSGLAQMGLDLEVISITKASSVISVQKASALTEFRTKKQDTIHMIVFEQAFERLSQEQQQELVEGAISNISYDTEKDKINIDKSQYGEVLRMRQKFTNYIDVIEIAQASIEQIAEEEKQRKQAEREAKKRG